MKPSVKISTAAVIFVLTYLSTGEVRAQDSQDPQLETLAPAHVFAPPGFDTNDRSEIVLTGYLPNTCYKTGPVEFSVDRKKQKIYIRNQAYSYQSCWCLFVLVPYVQTVDLGVIGTPGNYEILVEQTGGTLVSAGEMPIRISANSGPDDLPYALVNEASVTTQTEDRRLQLTMSLSTSKGCMEFKEIQIPTPTAKNIIEVLPIVEIKDGVPCGPLETFQKSVTIKNPWIGQTLVHVRSLNGQSKNLISKAHDE